MLTAGCPVGSQKLGQKCTVAQRCFQPLAPLRKVGNAVGWEEINCAVLGAESPGERP